MAFSNALNGRMEELRFPNMNMRSSENDSPFAANMASKRDSNPFYSSLGPSAPDVRGSLQRRFTTDSSKLNLGRNSFGQQYTSMHNSTVRGTLDHLPRDVVSSSSFAGKGHAADDVTAQRTETDL